MSYKEWPSLYSPEGKVPQTENAIKALEALPLSVALHHSASAFFISSSTRPSSLLQSPSTSEQLIVIQNTFVAQLNGVKADGLIVRNKLVEIAETFLEENAVQIPVKMLAKRIAAFFHKKTLYANTRPLGVSLVLAGPQSGCTPSILMYTVIPDAEVAQVRGTAAGVGSQNAKADLEHALQNESPFTELLRIITKQYLEEREDVFLEALIMRLDGSGSPAFERVSTEKMAELRKETAEKLEKE